MDQKKRAALEAAGFKVGTAAEFLGLTPEEEAIVKLKRALSVRVRELRRSSNLTQKEFASKLKSSQSRVAKVEAASPDVSLDLMFRSFLAAGGRLTDLDIFHSVPVTTQTSGRRKHLVS